MRGGFVPVPPAPAEPEEPTEPRRRRRREPAPWPDRIVGIVVGVVLGVGIITAFVLFSSEDTIDAPALNDEPEQTRPAPGTQGR